MFGSLSLSRLIGVQRNKRPSFLDLIGLSRQRRILGELDAHLLRDIGLDPDEAMKEASRPVWDVPRHWRS